MTTNILDFGELDDEPVQPQKRSRTNKRPGSRSRSRSHQAGSTASAVLWNVLTVLLLLVVLIMGGVFTVIFFNPYAALNPFPPPPQLSAEALAAAAMPTATNMIVLPPTWTPTATAEPSATPTLRPTGTLPPTPTFFTLITPSPAPPTLAPTVPVGGYPFQVKQRPLAVPNIAHTNEGCNWLGVAGTVEDMSGGPKTQLIVTLGGTLNGKAVDPLGMKYSLTGVAPQYGTAGYEFVLGDTPVASKGTLWIQLIDQMGVPLSEKVTFDTFNDCEKNLIVISFKQVK